MFDKRADFKHVSVLQTYDQNDIKDLWNNEYKPDPPQ